MEHAEVESGGGIEMPLKRYVSSGNLQAYRRLSDLIGFRRPLKFGLYRLRPFLERPGLAQPMAYRLAYERPGPLGTLYLNVCLSTPPPTKYCDSGGEGNVTSPSSPLQDGTCSPRPLLLCSHPAGFKDIRLSRSHPKDGLHS
ncbi:hypothetical protein B9Z19DRAFT_1069470 [Tuber borchii]|uniref:Uncharacterized protein n=1 Tax=Tuber borchii TaxID=42251 RepID=A0A2T6ZBI2_TUBBO|nr:hypothetical protein B9Z19DRAFT_1069470 [Tuber borchii]